LPPENVPIFLNRGTVELGRIAAEFGPPEAMAVRVLKSGAKSLAELRFQLALDELPLGVAVLALMQRGLVETVPGTIAMNGQTGQNGHTGHNGHKVHANGNRVA
jgi:hypothetical protein